MNDHMTNTVHAGRATRTVIRCSLLDTVLADLTTSVVFFFERGLDGDRLAEGLARALRTVPAFGGRLRTHEDTLEIVCEDAGVPMTTLLAGETLAEAVGRLRMPVAHYVDHIDAPKARLGGLPLLTVRVSRLADGATALGCSWHHAVGDMQSFVLLMQAWSAAVEGTTPPQAQLLEDPDAYLDGLLPARDSGRPGFRLLDPGEAGSRDRDVEAAVRGTRVIQAYFGSDEVRRMRDEFSATAGRRLSANDVLCAHVLTTLRHLGQDTQAGRLAMPVNIRRYLEIPPSVVGNLVGEVYLSCAPGAGTAAVATQIRAGVEDFTRSHLSMRTSHAFLETAGRSRLRDCVPLGFDLTNRTFTFTSWCGFGLYDITFEGQRPLLFSPVFNFQLPWNAVLVEGFGRAGHFLAGAVPARIAGLLRSPDGQAELHRFRQPTDSLPSLASEVRNLA
ncbi:MAG TPA: acyltransferase [Streptosporangiaceae bacterium]|nr:acyltransferase [Streptosporangiaceae bacterium]